MKKLTGFILIFVLTISTVGCKKEETSPVSLTGFYFDTAVTITIYNEPDASKSGELINECFKICDNYENLFSRTIKNSDVSRINQQQCPEATGTIHNSTLQNNTYIQVNPSVAEIIKDSKKYSRLTGGAFDITIAPLTDLWHINTNTGDIPSSDAVKNALKHINHKNITVKENSVKLSDSRSQIDLGGIAKGYVADKIKDYLISQNISSAIIDLGGNILTIGSKTESSDFTIGIKKPFSDNPAEYAATINISDKSVVTSGIYERYFKKDGNIYHHILDPKTGYPAKNALYSVTIISDKSEDGDALSTGTFLLGLDKGLSLINSLENTEAIFITDKNDIILSDGLTIKDKKITFCK